MARIGTTKSAQNWSELGKRVAVYCRISLDRKGESESPERQAALCRELTKLHEEILRGDLASLAQACAGSEPRGEIVIVIAPPAAAAPVSEAEADSLLRAALLRVSLKDAVGEVADATGLPRREIYQRALALTKEGKNDAPR